MASYPQHDEIMSFVTWCDGQRPRHIHLHIHAHPLTFPNISSLSFQRGLQANPLTLVT